MRTSILTCQRFTVIATEHLEGVLSLPDRVQVWFHLSWCRRCQAYLQQLRQTIATLARLPSKTPAESLRNDLVRRFSEAHNQDRESQR